MLMGLLGNSDGRGCVRGGACGARLSALPPAGLQISLQRAEGHMLEYIIDLVARTGGIWTVQWPTQGRGTVERSINVQY